MLLQVFPRIYSANAKARERSSLIPGTTQYFLILFFPSHNLSLSENLAFEAYGGILPSLTAVLSRCVGTKHLEFASDLL